MLRLWCSRCDLGITQAGHLHLCCLPKRTASGLEVEVQRCEKQHDSGVFFFMNVPKICPQIISLHIMTQKRMICSSDNTKYTKLHVSCMRPPETGIQNAKVTCSDIHRAAGAHITCVKSLGGQSGQKIHFSNKKLTNLDPLAWQAHNMA